MDQYRSRGTGPVKSPPRRVQRAFNALTARRAEAAHRHVGQEKSSIFLGLRAFQIVAAEHFGRCRAGRDDIGGDALGRQFQGPAARHADDAGLRRAVSGAFRPPQRPTAGDVDDAAIAPRDHPRQYRLGALHGCANVDVQDMQDVL
jgi:hypothetical protein